MSEPERQEAEPLSTEAFTAELQALIPQVRAFTRFLCRSDRAAADDLTQDTLTRAWTHRDSFQPGTNMRAWLFVIARNTFYSERRRAKRTVSTEAELEGAAAADSAQDHHMDLEDVRKALAALTDEQREALILVAAGGFSYEEAAQICGCAIGTIKSRVNRARTALATATGHDLEPAGAEL